jgi:hypothetical protein
LEHKHLSFFRTNSFRSDPAGRGEGAGLETPYELDVGILSPASIESKALAKGAHAIEKQVVLPNENGADWQERFKREAISENRSFAESLIR